MSATDRVADPQVRRLRLVGDVDIGATGALYRQLREYVRMSDDPRVVVDLSGVTFMDCAGLEPLTSALNWLARRDRRLVLVEHPASVNRLFASLRAAGCLPPFEGTTDHDEQPALTGQPDHMPPDAARETLRYRRYVAEEAFDGVAELSAPDNELERLREQVAQLKAEQRARTAVELAKGVLMGHHGIDADEASARLTSVASEHGLRVVDLARALAAVTAGTPSGSTSAGMMLAVQAVQAALGRAPSPGSSAPA